MKTVKIIFCVFMQIIVAQHISAQTLKARPNLVEIDGQTCIRFGGTGDAVDIVTKSGSNPMEGEADLIWGAFYNSQPNNPGLFRLTSVMANGWTPCFTVRANGNVGIFNNFPSTALEIGTVGSTRQVKVNGSIVVGSDLRMKTDIKNIDSSIKKIGQLRSVSYMFKQNDEILPIPQKVLNSLSQEEIQKLQMEVKKAKLVTKKTDNRTSYGFLAQELKEVFPDLVYADSAGMLSVDYIGIIPFLVKAIQEQQEQIDGQQAQIEELKSAVPSNGSLRSASIEEESTGIPFADETMKEPALYQNTPNPFNVRTEIRYSLTGRETSAMIYIFNMQGSLIKKYLTDGSCVLSIEASELTPGMYIYTLVADGKEVDTKRMILTN